MSSNLKSTWLFHRQVDRNCLIQLYKYLGRRLIPQSGRYPGCGTLWTRTRHWEIPKETYRIMLKAQVKLSWPSCKNSRIDVFLLCVIPETVSEISSPERRRWWCGTWGSAVAPCSDSAAAWEGKPGRSAVRPGQRLAPRNTGSVQMATMGNKIYTYESNE